MIFQWGNIKKSVEEYVSLHNGTLIEPYKSSRFKVTIECQYGHLFKQWPRDLLNNNQLCKKCCYEMNLKDIILLRKGKLLSLYEKNDIKVDIQCEYEHFWQTTPKTIRNGSWCPICKESHLERSTRLFFESINMHCMREITIEQLSKKKFDFYFQVNDQHYLLELDGCQHFQYEQYYHKSIEFFYKQNIDRLKTLAAVEFGYRLIRIDYTQINNIGQHIINAIQENYQYYVSNTEMYLYLSTPIPPEIIIKHCPELAFKYNLIPRCGDAILEIVG